MLPTDLPKNNAPAILLVEDDLDDQEFLAEVFKEELPGASLYIVNNGRKALEFLQAGIQGEIPALIILDYNLPEVNGAEVLAAIQNEGGLSHVIKVVWSTSDSPFFRQTCMELGAKAYLVKPSNLTGLRNMGKLMLELGGLK